MLVNQLTELLLETTNPLIDDGLTNHERVNKILNANLPYSNKTIITNPDLPPNSLMHRYVEKDVLVPFAILDSIEGQFELGKQVVYPDDSILFKEFDKLNNDGFIMDDGRMKDLSPNDNNFIDPLILGVYLHSRMLNNNSFGDSIMYRNTNRKIKEFSCNYNILYQQFHVKLDLTGKVRSITPTDTLLKSIKVVVQPSHIKSNMNGKKGKSNNTKPVDDEVDDVTINVGVEEAER